MILNNLFESSNKFDFKNHLLNEEKYIEYKHAKYKSFYNDFEKL